MQFKEDLRYWDSYESLQAWTPSKIIAWVLEKRVQTMMIVSRRELNYVYSNKSVANDEQNEYKTCRPPIAGK